MKTTTVWYACVGSFLFGVATTWLSLHDRYATAASGPAAAPAPADEANVATRDVRLVDRPEIARFDWKRHALDHWRRTLDDPDPQIVEWDWCAFDTAEREYWVVARTRSRTGQGGVENKLRLVVLDEAGRLVRQESGEQVAGYPRSITLVGDHFAELYCNRAMRPADLDP